MRIRWKGFELPTKVTSDESTHSETFGRFYIEPFERGFGHTIGNSLRRVLLSSMEGAAPFALKIEGVVHEFSAIEGVYQDVPEIVLNLKNLLIKMETDDERTITINKSGKGILTAGDIQTDHTVTVLNPDMVICELTEDVTLKAEVQVKKGRGYVPGEEHQQAEGGEREVGLIYIDSIFSPITNVSYRVEKTRVGRDTNYDRLVIDVNTDGSILPEDALVECGIILRKHMNPFVKYFDVGEENIGMQDMDLDSVQTSTEAPAISGVDEELAQKLAQSIRVLEPSVRVSNCLEEANVRTLGDLVQVTEPDLLSLRNFGKTSLDELKEKLTEMGLAFGMNVGTPSQG